jgi:hypothetical protein
VGLALLKRCRTFWNAIEDPATQSVRLDGEVHLVADGSLVGVTRRDGDTVLALPMSLGRRVLAGCRDSIGAWSGPRMNATILMKPWRP